MRRQAWRVASGAIRLAVEVAPATPARGGAGAAPRPLLLVHGTTTDASLWDDTRDALNEGRDLYLLNRRGRGGSDDEPVYDVAAEGRDLRAVLDAIADRHAGALVDVVAHSYGALCFLLALADPTCPVGRAVIYEPPLLPPTLLPSAAFTAALHADLAAGQREAVVEAFFRQIEGLNDRQLAKLRGMRAWAMRVASAPTIPRELEGVRHYDLPAAGLGAWPRPVLHLVGGLSPSVMREASEKVAACFRQAKTELLPGQRHGAMNSAPALFVDAVLAFLVDPVGPAVPESGPA